MSTTCLTFGNVFLKENVNFSFLQKLPGVKKYYRNLLPFFPITIEQFDLSKFDVIISSSHAVAKGVLVNSSQLHIFYCYTPMRYAWDLYHEYLNTMKGLKKAISRLILHKIRNWDLHSSRRVDHFIAISRYIARRIKKIYGKEARVIYPPVDTHLFLLDNKKEEYYITCSRLVPYKKIDLIVRCFAFLPDKKLVVVGDGPEMKRIKSYASKNVEILGYQKNEVIRNLISKAKAFVFAAEEDFGILPVEVQAAGIPVIAFGKGGTLETVIEKETGVFFYKQEVKSLIEAIEYFEKSYDNFDPEKIKLHAEKFSKKRFIDEFNQFVNTKVREHYEGNNISWR